jgi:ABC-type multidrug transport system fused ATPase/permease subunit
MLDPKEYRRGAAQMLHYLGLVRGMFFLSVVLLLLGSILTAAKAWMIQPVVDSFQQGSLATSSGLAFLCLIVLGIFLLQALLHFAYAVLSRAAGSRVVRAMRQDLFDHLLRQELGSANPRGSYEVNSRVVNDVAAFEAAAVDALQSLLRDGLTVLLLFGVLLYHERELALVCFTVLSLIGLLLRQAQRRIRSLSHRVQEMVSRLVHQLGEMIDGMEVVLAFGLARVWQEKFRLINDEHYRTVMRLQTASFAAVASVQVLISLGLTAILFLTGWALLRGEISEGQFLSFLGAMYLMQQPVISIGQKTTQISRGLAASTHAFEILSDEPVAAEPADPVPLPGGPLGFELCKVEFAYGDRLVLREVSLAAAPKEFLVLMGDSGGGKTTIARLLLRFQCPRRGEVRVGGVPVERVDRRELCRAIGYVSQDVFLFTSTVRSNVALGRPDASGEEIASVLRTCCLEEFVAGLPQGLDTMVGNRGAQLSGGQRQRIAIARALLMAPRLLILDEATSALDAELERRLLWNLVEDGRAGTILAVTHRPSVIEMANRVAILRDGRIIASASESSRDSQAADPSAART